MEKSKIDISKININKMIYFFWGLYIFSIFMNNTTLYLTISPIEKCIKMIRYVCYFIFCLKILYDWRKGCNITWRMLLIVAMSFIIYLSTKNRSIVFLVIILLGVRNLEFEKLIKIALKVFSILFFGVIILSLLKILPDWTYKRGDVVRHSLGFFYPTDTFSLYLLIMLMYFYVRKSKCTYIELIVLEIVNIFLYKYTDGRLSFILITAILVIMALSKINILRKIFNNPINKKILKILIYVMPIILFSSIFILANMYSAHNSIAINVNKLLSNRVRLISEALEEHNLTLFGENIEWHGWGGYGYVNDIDKNYDYNFVDSSYARILFDYGIIPTIIILITYTKLLTIYYRKKDSWMLFTLFFILIWSYIEPYIIRIDRNLFVLAYIPLLNMGEIKKLNYNYIKERIKKENEKEKVDN